MNNPNPFVPKGSLLEQNKRRSRLKLGVFCVLAVGIVGLTAMLIQGCKRENENADNTMPSLDTNVPAIDTNMSPLEASNPPVAPTITNPPAAVAPMPPPIETPQTTEYTVVAHDTLGKIAKAHGISLKALEDANPNVQPTRLKVGQKLEIPAGSGTTEAATSTSNTGGLGEELYTIKSGDTLTKIAKENGVSLKALKAANPNVDPNHIKVGHKLKIPGKAESAPAPAPAETAAPQPIAPAAPMTNQ